MHCFIEQLTYCGVIKIKIKILTGVIFIYEFYFYINVLKQEGNCWFNDNYREVIKKRNELRKNMLQFPLKENKIEYETQRRETHKVSIRKKKKWY